MMGGCSLLAMRSLGCARDDIFYAQYNLVNTEDSFVNTQDNLVYVLGEHFIRVRHLERSREASI